MQMPRFPIGLYIIEIGIVFCDDNRSRDEDYDASLGVHADGDFAVAEYDAFHKDDAFVHVRVPSIRQRHCVDGKFPQIH